MSRSKDSLGAKRSNGPRLYFEPLEDRNLLAFVVDSLGDVSDGDFSTGNLTLREAIEQANEAEGPDEITFAAALDGQTIELAGTELQITDSLTIDGSSLTEPVVISGSNESRVFRFSARNGGLTLRGLHIRNGLASQGGGVYFEGGSLVVEDSVVSHSAASSGGGVFSEAGETFILGSTINSNTSTGRGGGLNSRNITMIDSVVSGNEARAGGGIHTWDAEIQSSRIFGNHADFEGGGILADWSLTLNDSQISSNSAGRSGGGVTARSAAISESRIQDNTAGVGGGGGIHVEFGLASISQSTILGNQTRGDGGGVLSSRSSEPLSIVDSTLSANIAEAGGAVSATVLTLESSTLSGNYAERNGGGLTATEAEISQTWIYDNVASRMGGGISVGTLLLEQSTLSSNVSQFWGGAINVAGSATISNSTLSMNSAETGGAIFAFRTTEFILDSSTIYRNTSQSSGGIHARSGDNFTIRNSIVSGNFAFSAPNMFLLVDALSVEYSLIDVPDPMLGFLASNGGPTRTHALLPGSPAFNAGDPELQIDDGSAPYFDQRGFGYTRVVGGRIDIGAVERQLTADVNSDGSIDVSDLDLLQANIVYGPPAPELFDLNFDGLVNIADRDQWLAEAGAFLLSSGQPFQLGDANLDGQVDTSDFNLWNSNKFTFESDWSSGDFNVDGAVDISDFNIWNERRFTSSFDQSMRTLRREYASDVHESLMDQIFGSHTHWRSEI